VSAPWSLPAFGWPELVPPLESPALAPEPLSIEPGGSEALLLLHAMAAPSNSHGNVRTMGRGLAERAWSRTRWSINGEFTLAYLGMLGGGSPPTGGATVSGMTQEKRSKSMNASAFFLWREVARLTPIGGRLSFPGGLPRTRPGDEPA
jgi:hypothetical protein